MILDVQADVGKTHLRSLHLHYNWKSDCFQREIYIVSILNLKPDHVCSIHFDQEESEYIHNTV